MVCMGIKVVLGYENMVCVLKLLQLAALPLEKRVEKGGVKYGSMLFQGKIVYNNVNIVKPHLDQDFKE